MQVVNPVPAWDGGNWYGGHFWSGRPGASQFDPTKHKRAHVGLDMAAPHGSDIVAMGDGRVIARGYNTGAGNYVVLYHQTWDTSSRYLHIRWYGTFVNIGEQVSAGQKIAEVGSTGSSAAPHLHVEMLYGRTTYETYDTNLHLDIEYLITGKPGRKGDIEMITSTQEKLKETGYYHGVVDGIWGPQSDAAYKRYFDDSLKSNGGGGITLPTTVSVEGTLEMRDQGGL